jgi:predicted TIM-barrel fold metal-dependent hydrolase
VTASYFTTDDIGIIDSDSHLTERAGLWTDHAPARFKNRVPRVVQDEHGHPTWIVGDGIGLGPISYTPVAPDGSRIEGDAFELEFDYEDVHPGAYDGKARLDWMNNRGIQHQVLFPNTLAGFGGVRLYSMIDDVELRTACFTIYNDAAAEMQRDSGGRLLPLAMIPWWNIDAAEKEVRRARELGLVGITMPDNPHDYGLPALHKPEWSRFWSTCEDVDTAVSFHIAGGSFSPEVWTEPGLGEHQATLTAASFLTNTWVVANLIFSGLLLNHPRLKVYSAETGIGWMPFLLEAMDYQWHENITSAAKREAWKDVLPSEIFRRNIYVSFWFEEWGVVNALEAVGADNVMFETDFPHGTALLDRSKDKVAATLASLKPEVRRKVLRDNAARLFGLPNS